MRIREEGHWKEKFPEVFKEGLGTMKGIEGKLYPDKDVSPKFFKARSVPYAMKDKVAEELMRLKKEGVIEEVNNSEWATPIVPILKKDGTVRICGDYKITLNKVCKLDCYPIPRIDDLYANLAGGITFTTLDLSNAYLQMPLSPESKPFTTINTQLGLFQYNRLCFGIASAPAMFQRVMDNLLKGIKHVSGYLDDILITGSSDREHRNNIDVVLRRLEDAGIRVKEEKCHFMKKEVEYLGYLINKEGLKPLPKNIKTIKETPVPKDTTQLRAYLGMLNYYSKFLKNMSNLLGPLHGLLKKNVRWLWTKERQKSFEDSKERLIKADLLVHFDAKREIILTCDASKYGIGAVMSHIMDDGTERPILFVSRTLAPAERNYSQIEKEALGVIFAVKKFHRYIFGHKFTIANDHQPLQRLFNAEKELPTMVSGRIKRWALILSTYEYQFRYLPGSKIPHADAMSRLPVQSTIHDNVEIPIPAEIIFMLKEISGSVGLKEAQKATKNNPELQRIRKFIEEGWPENEPVPVHLKGYFSRKSELTIEQDILMWGTRVVVPLEIQKVILTLLHEGHPGICRMKGLARSYYWWPSLDDDIEAIVRECSGCQSVRKQPNASYGSWTMTKESWQRIHVDFAGPFLGQMFLIMVDAHSKWLEIIPMTIVSSKRTTEEMDRVFATHGIPTVIVSDNGTNFSSEEFTAYMNNNHIKHIFTPPYHPASNGIAERAVQTFKNAMKSAEGEGSVQSRINTFLLRYRLTPHTTTGKAPCEVLMGRTIRSKLDFLRPIEQSEPKRDDNWGLEENKFEPGETVFAVDFRKKGTWVEGVIEDIKKSIAWIKLNDGRRIRRHTNHIRDRGSSVNNREKEELRFPKPKSLTREDNELTEDNGEDILQKEPDNTMSHPVVTEDPLQRVRRSPVLTEDPLPPVRRSSRVTRKPLRLDL